jgi:hypothetical protein
MMGRGRMFGDPFNEILGRGRREEERVNVDQVMAIDDSICAKWQELGDDQTYDDVSVTLTTQLSTDERIIEALLLILVCNDKCECELIPCLSAMIKVQTQGIPVLRNKVINAITFLLKSLASNDKETIVTMFPNAQIESKKTVLILIGTIRILLRNNRQLMKYILKGLIFKEENL